MQPAHNTNILKHVLLVILGALLSAFPDVSHAAPTPQSAPKVGLVLSGGGARGAAHIGVLKVLEREGVKIDCIAGTSFGALVGGLYALGYRAAEIEEIFAKQDWSSIFSDAPERSLSSLFERRNFRYQGHLSFVGFSPELPSGLYRGQKIIEVLDALTTQRMIEADYDFDRLPIPFRAVATDLLTGERYVFNKGRMTEALRASMAIPMIFAPVEKEDMLLADGGLSDNFPTDVALKMGADFIIAVDVTSPLLKKEEIRSLFDVLDQSVSLAMRQNIEKNLNLADFIIRPDLESFTYSSYEAIAEIQKRGEEEAERQFSSLKEKLGPVSPIVEPRNPIGRPIGSIASIEFHGLRKISTRQLMGEIRSRVGDPLDPAILSGDLKRLYATNLFENVDYSVEPLAGQGYRLTFLLQEAPLNTLGASIRYDKEYKFVALAEFTARQIFNTSSTLTLSSQFGGLEDHSLALRIIPPQLSALFLEPRVNISRLDRSDIRNKEQVDTFRDKRVGGQLMLGGTFGLLEVAAGYRQESVSIRGGSEPNRQEDSVSLAGLTFRINRDTLDQQEFAQKGMVLRLQVDKRFKTLGGDLDYSRWEAGLRPFISISEKSTLELSAVAGYSRGPLPFYERFYAGAYSFAGKGPHHFLGFSRDELAANQLAMLAASYRYRIFSHPISFARRGFLFGTFNFAAVSSQETSPYDFTYFNGGGFGLAIDTLLGPARIALGWGSSGKPKLYISMGPTF